MKNIVFITNSLGFGGAEKMLTFVANSLSLRGHKCAIINLNTIPNYVNAHMQIIEKNVKVYTLENIGIGNKNVFRIRKIKQIASEFNAEVLVGFTGFPNMYAKIVGLVLGIPSIMSERGDPKRTKANSIIKEKISKFIINQSTGGVFQTEGAMDYYGRGLRRRSIVIPNPVFIKGTVPKRLTDERLKTVVSVGRFDNEQKRYDIMLKSFALFSKYHPDYILKLYGNGPDLSLIKDWARKYGILNKVEFMGVSENPMKDIVNDGMFIITSDYEGISNALLEAMAIGLPCVSTDHTPGGARLLIKDHENGLLVPVRDAYAIASAMSEFVTNHDLAEKCGENATKVLQRFAPDKIAEMWEQYIEKIGECKY